MSSFKSAVELNKAISERNINSINEILFNNPDLLKDDEWSRHALMTTLLLVNNNEEILKLLILYGANSNLKNYLTLALQEASLEYIEVLLKNGAKLQVPQWGRISPAEYVFLREKNFDDRKEILELLFTYGLDPLFQDWNNRNLINIYIEESYLGKKNHSNEIEIIEVLLNNGVPINRMDNDPYPPLTSAICFGSQKMVSFLVEKGATAITDDLFHKIVLYDQLDFFDFLLSIGADINGGPRKKWTALHEACQQHDHKIISVLIQNGADISKEDENDETPFSQLDPDEDGYHESLIVMIKEISKLNYKNVPIHKKDMESIQKNSEACAHFKACNNELNEMGKTELNPPNSFFSILNNSLSVKKLSKLTNNEQVVYKFEKNVHRFLYFKNDLEQIWNEACKVREKVEVVVSRLYLIFGDTLPNVVVRKLAKSLTVENLPVE